MENTQRAARRNNQLGRQRGTGAPEKRRLGEASYGEAINRAHLAMYFNSRPGRSRKSNQ